MNALVAGVGNVFFRDDGFGVEVARRLSQEPLPAAVEVEDYGIRGIHLAYRLLEGVSLLVVVDAVRRGGAPGTLYLLEPDLAGAPPGLDAGTADAHALDVVAVLETVRTLGGELPPVRIVGCEPETLDEGMGLSPTIDAAVGPAMELVRDVLRTCTPVPSMATAIVAEEENR